jgi:hypothetical protein
VARQRTYIFWTPGEFEDDLHGFLTVRERDRFERGEPGPFRRIVRDHHKLGPVPAEILAVREITDKWR